MWVGYLCAFHTQDAGLGITPLFATKTLQETWLQRELGKDFTCSCSASMFLPRSPLALCESKTKRSICSCSSGATFGCEAPNVDACCPATPRSPR